MPIYFLLFLSASDLEQFFTVKELHKQRYKSFTKFQVTLKDTNI